MTEVDRQMLVSPWQKQGYGGYAVVCLLFVSVERSFSTVFSIQCSPPPPPPPPLLPPSFLPPPSPPLFQSRFLEKEKKETPLLIIGYWKNGNWEWGKKECDSSRRKFLFLKWNFFVGKWKKIRRSKGGRSKHSSTWNVYRYNWIFAGFLFIEKFNTRANRVFYWSLKIKFNLNIVVFNNYFTFPFFEQRDVTLHFLL